MAKKPNASVLVCGQCVAGVAEEREDGSKAKRLRCGVSLGRIVSPKSPCSADMADLCTAYTQIGGEIYRRALAMKDRKAGS